MVEARWPALVIALVYAVGGYFGSGFDVSRLFGLVAGGVMVFCQSLVGLALARSIPGFEPLPVVRSLQEQERPVRSVLLLAVIGAVAGFVALLVGSVGLSIALRVFGEVARTSEAAGLFPSNPVQAFFLLLSGAGIAEEAVYRLVCVSLFWWLTGRRWIGVVMGAVLFAAYHLTPLDTIYLTFWQYPISQFISSFLIGLLWGYLFSRRGYETAVLGHTMSDWIGLTFFMH